MAPMTPPLNPKEKNLYLFHLQKVQSLLSEDFAPIVNCVRWFLEQYIVQPNFLSKVLLTDEATFSRDGILNSRNSQKQDKLLGTT